MAIHQNFNIWVQITIDRHGVNWRKNGFNLLSNPMNAILYTNYDISVMLLYLIRPIMANSRVLILKKYSANLLKIIVNSIFQHRIPTAIFRLKIGKISIVQYYPQSKTSDAERGTDIDFQRDSVDYFRLQIESTTVA